MAILKSKDLSPFTQGDICYLIHSNGPMSVALECEVVSSSGNRITCDGRRKIPCGSFTHRDEKLESLINQVGQRFTESKDMFHRDLDMFPKQ